MGKTKIEWTTHTWNPVTGCTKVSPGCDNCYAEKMSNRLQHHQKYAGVVGAGRWTGLVKVHPEELDRPLCWKEHRRIFVCSMSDLFHSAVPWDFIAKVFDVMAASPWHTYQVLTKRPGRMAHFAEHIWPWGAWPAHVWAGTSVESQKYARRLDCLSRVPAKVRFVSAEPLLGPLRLGQWLHDDKRCGYYCDPAVGHVDHYPPPLSWVICGGESGPGARPMNLEWVRGIRDQCQQAGVPFFYKQVIISGKKVGTPLLDGRQWKEFPNV